MNNRDLANPAFNTKLIFIKQKNERFRPYYGGFAGLFGVKRKF